jgi:hypothetical protein
VADLESKLKGILEVLIDVPLRINDHGGSTFLVPNQIGSMSEATQIVLLEDHHP